MKPLWLSIFAIVFGLVLGVCLIIIRASKRFVSRQSIARWFRELGVLLKHNVPVNVALDTCAERTSEKIGDLSQRLREAVREGDTLSHVLRRELALPHAVTAMINAAEIGGTLPDALIDSSQLLMSMARPWIALQSLSIRMEFDQEQKLIYEVAESFASESDLTTQDDDVQSPLVRIAHGILAQAIRSGAESVDLEPARTQKPPRGADYQDEEEWRLLDMEIGPQLLVIFGRDKDRWEVMRIPKYIIAPLYRRLKLMAEVPYWQKAPVSGRIAVRLGDRDFFIYLDSEMHPLGEKLSLHIRGVG